MIAAGSGITPILSMLKSDTSERRKTVLYFGTTVADFIFADESFKVKSHVNYDVEYSDHYPVMASFDLNTD